MSRAVQCRKSWVTYIAEGICACGDLIANGGEDERGRNEEFGRPRIELGNDGRHIPRSQLSAVVADYIDLLVPFEFAPDIRMRISNKDWSKSAKCADDR